MAGLLDEHLKVHEREPGGEQTHPARAGEPCPDGAAQAGGYQPLAERDQAVRVVRHGEMEQGIEGAAGQEEEGAVLGIDLAKERVPGQVPAHRDHDVAFVVVPQEVREDARIADNQGRTKDDERASRPREARGARGYAVHPQPSPSGAKPIRPSRVPVRCPGTNSSTGLGSSSRCSGTTSSDAETPMITAKSAARSPCGTLRYPSEGGSRIRRPPPHGLAELMVGGSPMADFGATSRGERLCVGLRLEVMSASDKATPASRPSAAARAECGG